MCWGKPEIKTWPDVASLVRAPIPGSIPFWIAPKLLARAIDGHVVQPEPATPIELLHHIDKTEVVELSAVRLVLRAYLKEVVSPPSVAVTVPLSPLLPGSYLSDHVK